MNRFIRNNFLAICITLSVIFAFAKKATIFQQETPKLTQPIVLAVNQQTNAVFQKYWKMHGVEITKFFLKQDSLLIGEATLSYRLKELDKDQPNGVIYSLSFNFTQKIIQGDYNYSENTTTITPLNTPLYPHALSVVSSSQSNDGTDFLSFQPQPKSYLFIGRNSVEPEKEIYKSTEKGNLEDEIWAKIRLNLDALPQGEIEMIPSLGYWNKIHKSPSAQEVKAELKDLESTKKLKIYSLNYPALKRKLDIVFEASFPFQIIEFRDMIDGKTIIGSRETSKEIPNYPIPYP